MVALVTALLLSTSLYWPAVGSPFVYDDWAGIANNHDLTSWSGLWRFLSAPVDFSREFLLNSGAFYRPAYWVSVAVDRYLWNLHSTGYHLTNLIVHAANIFLLWRYLRELKFTWQAAALAAALWASFAVNSETVIWISARGYTMVTFSILLSQIVVLHCVKSRQMKWAAVYGLCFAFALMCHELGVVIFPATALTLWISGLSLRERLARALLLTGGAVALIYLVAYRVLLASTNAFQFWGVGATFFKYVFLIAWPLHLSIERSSDTPSPAFNTVNAVAWLALIALGAGIFLIRKRSSRLLFGTTWLVLFLLPFSGVLPLYQGMAERYLYPASIGFAIVLLSLTEMMTPKMTVTVCLSIAALNSWRTIARANNWRDEETLYTSSLAATPKSAVLFFNLGTLYKERGDTSNAARYFERAVVSNPHFERAYVGLGNSKLAEDDMQGAEAAYLAALAIDGKDPGATLNLGAAYQRAGDLANAETQYRKAIELEPNRADGYINLGTVLLERGRADEATTYLVKAVSLDRRNPTIYFNLGAALEQSGQATVAASMYQKAIQLKPDYGLAKAALQKLKSAERR